MCRAQACLSFLGQLSCYFRVLAGNLPTGVDDAAATTVFMVVLPGGTPAVLPTPTCAAGACRD
eukprot:2284646-Alexandrium_andersonii.AAC.1